MRLVAVVFLLLAPWAFAQEKKEPEKREEPQQPPRQLILRLDQLPANERADLTVRETAAPRSDELPELGGRPSKAYDAAGVRGSGTSAPGSPYPADNQMPGR